MSKARSIREVMVRNGVPEGDIPKSWLRKREEGENLRKQKHAANEKRLAAEKTLELMRVEKQKAETLVLSLSWGTYVRRFGWGGSGGHQSQITCAGFQPWGIRVSNHM